MRRISYCHIMQPQRQQADNRKSVQGLYLRSRNADGGFAAVLTHWWTQTWIILFVVSTSWVFKMSLNQNINVNSERYQNFIINLSQSTTGCQFFDRSQFQEAFKRTFQKYFVQTATVTSGTSTYSIYKWITTLYDDL